jgi:EAL and modified HD-GYP domain-containing signal transduction protein
MAIQQAPGGAAEVATIHELAGGLRYLARQPILDLRGQVHGYELLFRAGPELAFRGDGNQATRIMLDNSVLFGIEKLAGGKPAFVNCTMESLTGHLVEVLPPASTVLEILEDLEPTPELIAACRKLKDLGFRIALDDFVWEPKFEPLIELADYIKVDIMLTSAYKREELIRRVRGTKIKMLAEKVETQEDHKRVKGEGFTLFQGYYFCRPVLIKNRTIPANPLFYIQILKLLHEENLDLSKLTRLVKREASLTYRLLRLVNSPLFAVQQEVVSIQSALVAVGEHAFRRIATLAIASELNGKQPAEILRMAFVRGRFCEAAAEHFGLDYTEQYLLGMLSLLPAMLQSPMEDLTPTLPLREGIRQALNGKQNPERGLLHWLECYERDDWGDCANITQGDPQNQQLLVECYAESIIWAEAAIHSAS